jgi:hypothetical protein
MKKSLERVSSQASHFNMLKTPPCGTLSRRKKEGRENCEWWIVNGEW